MLCIYTQGFASCSACQNYCVDSNSTVSREISWKCCKLMLVQSKPFTLNVSLTDCFNEQTFSWLSRVQGSTVLCLFCTVPAKLSERLLQVFHGKRSALGRSLKYLPVCEVSESTAGSLWGSKNALLQC